MGLPLAKGDDLLVLDNRIYFKTIAGLERVDVIYRRLNDTHIDPVVFDTDRETAGVPGLLQCIRAGNVVVSNAIGAGVAESRALDVWLPRPGCVFTLGEKAAAAIGSRPTPAAANDQLDFILESRSTLRVRPAHDPRLDDPLVHEPAPVLVDERGLTAEVRENPRLRGPADGGVGAVSISTTRRSSPFHLSAYVLAQGRGISPCCPADSSASGASRRRSSALA